MTPVVEPSLKHHDFQKDACISQLQVCRRLHASCYKLLICPAEKPRHPMMRGTAVPGGKQRRTPGTLSQEFRARWKAGKDTCSTFAELPWQVDSRERTPGTLSRECRSRWVTYRQGHTVARRRSFPQCGPLPFSGADASFGLCMSLPSRKILAPDVLT